MFATTKATHLLLVPSPFALPALQASLSGSLWGKALLGQRAQRIEMLLLHEFYDKKFLLPDKLSNKVGFRVSTSGKARQHVGLH